MFSISISYRFLNRVFPLLYWNARNCTVPFVLLNAVSREQSFSSRYNPKSDTERVLLRSSSSFRWMTILSLVSRIAIKVLSN